MTNRQTKFQEQAGGATTDSPHPALKLRHTLRGHTAAVYRMALSPDGRAVLWVWEQALRVLQGELSPGSYQAYLREARPRVWEAEGRLVVRAPTRYARDWLRERAGKTLERMLCGILNQTVRVVFECGG